MKADHARILYIEDDPGQARLVQKRLKRMGYLVDLSYNGAEGLALHRANCYDVLLLDQDMPGMSGVEVITECICGPHVPITIMMTGKGNERLAVEALKLGATDYLVKDVEGIYLELLPSVLENALAQHRMEAEKDAVERELHESLSFNRAILDSLSAHIAIVDHTGVILDTNAAWKKFALDNGMADDCEGTGLNYLEICHRAEGECSDTSRAVAEGIRSVLTREADSFSLVYECSRGTDIRWFEMMVTPVRGVDPPVVVVAHENITALKITEEKLRKLSITDGLTGILNRRAFDGVIDREMARAVRSGQPISLVMVDIDHFKAYNDTYGHQMGDETIKRVAQTLNRAIKRSSDAAARYGGEEFACLLPETGLDGALWVARKIRESIERLAIPHLASPLTDVVTVSMGVASMFAAGDSTGAHLVRAADVALYEAKKKGRNRIELYG